MFGYGGYGYIIVIFNTTILPFPKLNNYSAIMSL